MFKGKTDSAPTVQPNVCFLSPSLILQYLQSIEREIHHSTRRRLPLQNENENVPSFYFMNLHTRLEPLADRRRRKVVSRNRTCETTN